LLDRLGQGESALVHHREAVRCRPDWADGHAGLGVALAGQGTLAEALLHLREAARLAPAHPGFQLNLGVALIQAGQAEEAVACLRRALELRPDYAEAAYNLGAVLASLGRREEAIAEYRRALSLRPGYGEACNNLGLALTESGRHAEAVVILRQAVRLRPQATEGYNNLGLALTSLGRFAEAEAALLEALRLEPGYLEAHNNLGSVYKEEGRLEEALASYQIALWHSPQSASTRYNRSLALLAAGQWEEGWREYEWRWRRSRAAQRPFRQPRWDGSPLAGKTVLLWSEQGLGDTVQFARFASCVKERGGRVILECPGCLLGLFQSLPGVDELVAEGQPLPHFDVQVPLMSLPGLLGVTVENIPGQVPYLHAEPQRVRRWKESLSGLAGFKVGVVWQGNPRHEWDHWRSFPLQSLEPLARVEGVRLVSLQKGFGSEQVRGLAGRFEVLELEGRDEDDGFLDTAAVLAGLDLVVSADTSVAHVAGALGVPVWLALARVSDWRWLRDKEGTPWYPEMRLFRQRELGDWPGVFGRMAERARGFAREEGAV
jgi:Flp pilus assembly protein TadD